MDVPREGRNKKVDSKRKMDRLTTLTVMEVIEKLYQETNEAVDLAIELMTEWENNKNGDCARERMRRMEAAISGAEYMCERLEEVTEDFTVFVRLNNKLNQVNWEGYVSQMYD